MSQLIFTKNLPEIKAGKQDYLFEIAEYFFKLSFYARREGVLAMEDFFSSHPWENEEGFYLINEKDGARSDGTVNSALQPRENKIFTSLVKCVTEGVDRKLIVERARLFLKNSCQTDLEKLALIIGANSILAIQSAVAESEYIVRISSLFGIEFAGECERRLRNLSNELFEAIYRATHENIAPVTEEIKARLLEVDSILRKKEDQLKKEMKKVLSENAEYSPPGEDEIPIQFVNGKIWYSSSDEFDDENAYTTELNSFHLPGLSGDDSDFRKSYEYTIDCENGKIMVCQSTKKLWGDTDDRDDSFAHHAEDFMRLTENCGETFGKHIFFMISIMRRYLMDSE